MIPTTSTGTLCKDGVPNHSNGQEARSEVVHTDISKRQTISLSADRSRSKGKRVPRVQLKVSRASVNSSENQRLGEFKTAKDLLGPARKLQLQNFSAGVLISLLQAILVQSKSNNLGGSFRICFKKCCDLTLLIYDT